MENCPFTGTPCPHNKQIHISEIENYTTKDTKNMCIFCGVPYLVKEGFGYYEISNPIYEMLNLAIKGKLSPPQPVVHIPACSCGCTLNDIAKTGKIGCAKCYEIFKDELTPIIMKCQNSLVHKGKVPKKIDLTALEEELKKAITEEDYTTAAKLRDEIKSLKGQ